MAQRPTPGQCVHCGQPFAELTWDHVFPRAWYPKNTPKILEKWKVPSCKRCNAEYGALEQDLLLRLGVCLGPEDYDAAGISEKALRTIKPEFAKTERDRRARQRARDVLRCKMIPCDYEIEIIFPGGPDPAQIAQRFKAAGQTEYRGPGLIVVHAAAHDDPLATLYKITIWGRLVMYAVVLPIQTQNKAERAD